MSNCNGLQFAIGNWQLPASPPCIRNKSNRRLKSFSSSCNLFLAWLPFTASAKTSSGPTFLQSFEEAARSSADPIPNPKTKESRGEKCADVSDGDDEILRYLYYAHLYDGRPARRRWCPFILLLLGFSFSVCAFDDAAAALCNYLLGLNGGGLPEGWYRNDRRLFSHLTTATASTPQCLTGGVRTLMKVLETM